MSISKCLCLIIGMRVIVSKETVVLCPNLFQLYLNVINGMSQANGDIR